MSWPLPNDFNEAVQTPATAFADPDLKRGQATVGPTGLPLPRSGNFADVYQILGADGRNWAVKCFTRSVPGLDKRYDLVGKALTTANLPFTIPFTFLSQGIRVGGKWYPALKMEWVDGLQLNQFVRENVGKPAILDGLFSMWVRLCKRLREAGLAHADLQHGNVLLVPGAKPGQFGLKLIDYDGLYAPALANTPSGELGHPAFQHPQRAAGRVYSPDLDRFPHLVVATALKGLAAAPDLWERFDTGDNLLFTEDDFKQPGGSKLLKELWATGNAGVQGLVGRLVLALGKPLPQTPWLDQIAPDGKVLPLPPADAQTVMSQLGFSLAGPAIPPHPPTSPPPVPRSAFNDFDPTPPTKKSALVPVLIVVGGLLALAGGAAGVIILFGDKKPNEVAQAKPTEPPTPPAEPPQVTEKPKDSDPAPPPPASTPGRPVLPPPRPDVAASPPPSPPASDLNVVELKPVWSVPMDTDHQSAVLRFTPTGRLVWAGPTRGILAFDPKTGKETARVPADSTRTTIAIVSVTDKGQVSLYQPGTTSLLTWDAATGRPGAVLDAKPVLTDRTTRELVRVSPNGRYLSASWQSGANNTPGAARVYDTVGKRQVVSADGRVIDLRFTPDSSRVLVVERGGRCRWYKLPSGTADGEFTLGIEENAFFQVFDLTQDGEKLLVSAALASGGGFGMYWVDGKTGKPEHSHLTNSIAYSGATDPGGRVYAHPHLIPGTSQFALEVQVYDAGGKLIARAPMLPPKGSQIPRLKVAVSDDARRLFVLNPETLTLNGYDLPVAGGRLAVSPKADGRTPVPPDEAVAKAAAEIRELYKSEFAKKSAADRKALAVKLLDVAADTKAAADQLALLREARDLYADAGEIGEVREVAGRIADRFAVDRFAFKLPTLEKLAVQSAAGPLREVAEWALAEFDAEFAADRYSQAAKLAAVAATAARRANSGPLLTDATDRTALVKKAEEQFAAVREAFDKLKTAPDDPTANLAMGKFRCLVQRRWADGIPHLAKGADAALKAVAEMDQSALTDRDLEAKTADAWAEYAKTTADADRPLFEARGRHWAFRAMEVLTGLELEKARSKLVLTHGKTEYLPGLMREITMKTSGAAKVPSEVFDRLDFNPLDIKDPNKGKLDFTVRWTGVLVPPKPGRYKLEVRTGAAVKVRVNNATMIDTAGKPPSTTGAVILPDQPVPFAVEGTFATDPKHTLTLLWLPPGSPDWEPIPAEHLYHPKGR